MEAEWRVEQAAKQKQVFMASLVRIRVDLTNIRTMLRLKMAEREEETNFFLPGGFVDVDKCVQGLEAGYETIAQLFFATPYCELLEASIPYLRNEQSFLKLEKESEDFVKGFLKTTRSIAAGSAAGDCVLFNERSRNSYRADGADRQKERFECQADW